VADNVITQEAACRDQHALSFAGDKAVFSPESNNAVSCSVIVGQCFGGCLVRPMS
jgi:hypothetical protein